ncbi:MAG TPA: DUF6265 family protein [Pyrinomonadaceae bacterium]|nr:DUF6265 family protein [Pyrinomonadaceae bacterium]
MKPLFAILLLGTSIVCAQQTGNVEVVKASWSKVRIGWERDPFGGPLENFDEMRSRARNERRIAQGGGERAKREARADEANLAKQRQKSPPRYYFIYKTKVKNNHTSAITQIDWDYVFFEKDTNNEMGRQQFTSDEQIGPGKTKELTVTLTSPPTRTVSVTSLNLEERDRFTEKIEVVRVQYADGRVWELSSTTPAPTPPPQSPTLGDLSWISGDWQTAPGGRMQIEEHWTSVAGGSMLGMSRTVAGDKTVEFEYIRIEQRSDGIYYVAHPKARCPGTDFKLTKSSATEAVFENPQHDFPKRITYRKTADEALTATIDGGEGSKAISFSFQRMKSLE